MHAEILAIGDEIASGQLLDTNSQWLSQRLDELGVRVLYHSTAGDVSRRKPGNPQSARHGADFGLAVGPFPQTAAPASEPPPLHFALASAAGVRRLHISSGIHPALARIYCAKHALNLVRLAML